MVYLPLHCQKFKSGRVPRSSSRGKPLRLPLRLDLVAKIAQPIAGAIDAIAGSSLKTCRKCQERKELLNEVGEKLGLGAA